MDPMLLGTATAFGLAASAGLNTTLPLLIVGLLARFGLLSLGAPYEALAGDVALGGLVVLAGLEIAGDKVAGMDTVVQAVQWPLASAAGAILFASQTSTVTDVAPGLQILVGLLTAGSVHGLRMAVRPLVTGLTFGLGNPVASTVEDATSIFLVLLAIVVPLLAVLFVAGLVVLLVMGGLRAARRGNAMTRRLFPQREAPTSS